MGAMKSKAEKVLVVESDEALREQVVAVLSDAGYEMSTEYAEGMNEELGLSRVEAVRIVLSTMRAR